MEINGTELALKIRENLKQKINTELIAKGKPAPHLAVVLVGENPASEVYVSGKIKACKEARIISEVIKLEYNIPQKVLNDTIKALSKNKDVNGILLQLPLPMGLNANEAINLIDPAKDVDGLTDINLGRLLANNPAAIKSCTPGGVIEMFDAYGINLAGKNVALINRSLLVGKPLAAMLTNRDATVTVCHTKTADVPAICKRSDIIISAVGKKNFITADMVKKGAVVIDIGIVKDPITGKLCGDVDFINVKDKTSFITPVPGGVGPMTIAMLLKNTVDIACRKN